MTSFDAGRGCPFQCSFCTIINVQGRKSRRRTPDDVERIVRANRRQGIHRFFITDDNFARNKDWEPIFDRLIELRETRGLNIELHHPGRHALPPASRTSSRRRPAPASNACSSDSRTSIPTTCCGAKKKQNKITEYRKMLLAWKGVGCITYCGYILGFPNDTPERILRDIALIKRELPLDLLEFFFLTPLPGSEDHQRLTEQASGWTPTSTSTTSITA